MKKDMDCQIFEDQLDTLLDSGLSHEGLRQLELHGLECSQCRTLLKVHDVLVHPSLKEIEAAVPQVILDGIWPEVRNATARLSHPSPDLAALPGARLHSAKRQDGATSGGSWLTPVLAAACLALLFSTGFLFSAWKRTDARGAQLAQEVGELRSGLADLTARTEWVERTAQLAGNSRNRARALDYVLGSQESITVQGLVELLERYPPQMVLFDATQVRTLSGAGSRPSSELHEVLTVLGEGLEGLSDDRGVRVGEFAEWLASSNLPRDLVLPKSPLIELLS